MEKKLSPIETVAREMAQHSELSEEQLLSALKRGLRHLGKRATEAIAADEWSDSALDVAQEYQAMSEMLNFFGSQLIAFEEIEAADVDRITN